MGRTGIVLALAGLGLVGCGDPANVAGSYSLSLTNQENGCEFPNWTVGAMASGVGLLVTQAGGDVTATVQGAAAAVLTVGLGSASFTGQVEGPGLSLKLLGTRAASKGGCAYTINAALNASLNGDVLQGSIEYRSATNNSPDCGAIQGCVSKQAFNGTRPPAAN